MGNILVSVLLVVLFFLAAFTAASETALIAVSRLKLRRLAAEGSKTAKIVLNILETPERFLGTILVANNIVETLIASIATAIMISIVGGQGRSVIVATAIATFLIIICEVTAKTLAARHSKAFSLALARPVRFLIQMLSPVVRILAAITNFIVNLVGSKSEWKKSLVTEDDIRTLIKVVGEEDVQQKEKYKMLSNVFDFSDIVVKKVMTPKKDMVSIDMNSNFDDIITKALESGYSRFPVHKDNPENFVGVINMKDLLNVLHNKDLLVLQDIISPVTIMPESKKVAELLREFQKGHTHIALVADPQGKITGLVTLEDLLEEIVGEIQDEYDVRSVLSKKTK